MKICKHSKKQTYFLNGKKTCPTCDILLIDLEIELDEKVEVEKEEAELSKGAWHLPTSIGTRRSC